MFVIVGLGAVTWLLCYGNFGGLLEVLFLSGPLVGSVIWPVISGIYTRRANPWGAFLAMLLGSGVGLWAYDAIGWFVASLIGTAVSMVVTLVSLGLSRSRFDWERLNEPHGNEAAATPENA